MYSCRVVTSVFAFVLVSGAVASAQEERNQHAFLGIMVGPAKDGTQGILIREVTPDSPAAKAGLKAGDVVVKMGDQEVKDAEGFTRQVFAMKPGAKATLRVLRDGKEKDIPVTLGERPQRKGDSAASSVFRTAFLGVLMEDLTPDLKARLNVDVKAGAVVMDVMPNSPAAAAGLKRDDVITAVDATTVQNSEALRAAIRGDKPGKEVVLHIVRGKEKMSLKATLEKGIFGIGPSEEKREK